MKHGILRIILTTLIVALVSFPMGVMAAGVFEKAVPATATINVTTPNLSLSIDQGGASPVSTVSFGNVNTGFDVNKGLYIRNSGDIAFTSVTMTTDLSPALGTITMTPVGAMPAHMTNGTGVTFTLSVPLGATGGPVTCNIILQGNY